MLLAILKKMFLIGKDPLASPEISSALAGLTHFVNPSAKIGT